MDLILAKFKSRRKWYGRMELCPCQMNGVREMEGIIHVGDGQGIGSSGSLGPVSDL